MKEFAFLCSGLMIGAAAFPVWVQADLPVPVSPVKVPAIVETQDPVIGHGQDQAMLRVLRAEDGNTVIFSDGLKVRLFGYDVPHPKNKERNQKYAEIFGIDHQNLRSNARKAAEFLNQLVAGKSVIIRIDRVNTVSRHKDEQNHLLVYLYTEDGVFVNVEMIRNGYGMVDRRKSFQYQSAFMRNEKQAKEARRGIWS